MGRNSVIGLANLLEEATLGEIQLLLYSKSPLAMYTEIFICCINNFRVESLARLCGPGELFVYSNDFVQVLANVSDKNKFFNYYKS